ncbi:MAG TPA: DUF397 domain-containing protein [Pseudonocardiaceae bacterium]|nr:DUF397 domain-containing protein [Pseudonocardiaceae bacterium]
MHRDTGWFKSSYSAAANDSCVEVRIADSVGVRDTKNRDAGTLWLTGPTWTAFLAELATAPTARQRVRPR